VLHVQGYDPHGIAEHHERFEREHRRTCALYDLTGEVGAAKESRDGLSATWEVSTKGDGWRVATRYTLLRFDDLVRRDMERAPWWKIVQMYRTVGVSILNGAFGRMLRANWRYALVAVAPILLITFWVLLGSFVGILCMNLVAALGAPEIVARTVGLVTGFGGFASILWLTEPLSGLLLRCDEAASIGQFVGGKRPDWGERLDAFARDVVDAAQEHESDEIIVVGHGFGAVLAINVLSRAFSRDGALVTRGPRMALLTLGASLPTVGFNPEAKGFRNRLRQLATAPDVYWIDVQSRDDILSFAPFDPIAGHGITLDTPRRNPQVMAVRFSDLWAEGSVLRRLRVAKGHAQYLAANERRGCPYDYTLICCGPLDLAIRAASPQQAEAALGGHFEPDSASGR
jgi:pimeloyl-ACP methyl ester carboxylesterase